MGKNNNIIEINGKKYDARTGAMLTGHGQANQSTPISEPNSTVNPEPKTKSMHDVVRQPAKAADGHKPKASNTLMRHAVRKPSKDTNKSKFRAQGPSEVALSEDLAAVVVSKSAKSVDHKKLAKASKVPQSHLIAHFGTVTSDVNSPEPVAQPVEAPKKQAASRHAATKSKPKTTAELLDHAIQQANSHEEPAPKHTKKRRSGKLALASVTAVMLLGFVAYQEMPKLQFSLASAKAGIGASMPNYQPAGYSLGKLSYSPGVVATKFTSNSDQRSYTLTQKASTWNSEALKENFIVNTSSKYQVTETGGRTIYLYGNGNASWVNGGIWYILRSNGSLSNQQLVEVAKSI